MSLKWIFFCVIILYQFLLGGLAFYFWRRFKKECVGKAFNFRITDIWAAMAAFSPTFITFSYTLKDIETRGWQRGDIGILWLVLLVLGASQLVGLLIGRIHIELPPHRGARTARQSAVSIVAGGLIGLFFPVVFAIGVMITATLIS